MIAMLLAAGKSERIQPLSKGLPKVLLTICGKTLLEHNLFYLKRNKIKKVVINTHYCADKIENFLRKKKHFGLNIVISREKKMMGTAGGVKNAKKHFGKESILVVYADNLTDFNLKSLRKTHSVSRASITLGVFNPRKTKHSGILAGQVKLSKKGQVIRFEERRSEGSSKKGYYVNAGVFMLSPRVLDEIPAGKYFDFSRDLFPLLLKKRRKICSNSDVTTVLASDTPLAYKMTCRKAPSLLKGQKIQ